MKKKLLANLFPFVTMGMFFIMGCRGGHANARKDSSDNSSDFMGKTPNNNNYNNPSSADTAYKGDSVVLQH